MNAHKKAFIDFATSHQVIRFGEFRLKSDRLSPYFFNLGLFNTGGALAKLGKFYADALLEAAVVYDMLFGPAYKGIPLVTSTAIALAQHHQINKPYAFNRKETKTHGEGGQTVGAPLAGKVLILDDVITAGTATRESIECIQKANAAPAGIVVALDRQEKGLGPTSAIQEIQEAFGIPVISLICLADLIQFLEHSAEFKEYYPKLKAYRQQFGIKT